MKRRLIILFLALTTLLSAFSGLASLLAAGPNSGPGRHETAPILVADDGNNSSDGASGGPTSTGSDGTSTKGGGSASTNGASWGG